MTWTAYQLDYRAESPVHIGWHRLGQIRRTRYFIPARNVWGASAAARARGYGKGWDNGNPYQQAETELGACARFTALFPWTERDGLLRPRYLDKGLHYNGHTPGWFEANFVHAVASVSIDPDSFTALDGALHEREYLHAPGMHFQGYVLLKNCERLEELDHLTVGGNLGYGYGMLRLVSCTPVTTLFEEQFTLKPDGSLAGVKGCHLAGFCSTTGLEALGEIELVSGRGTRYSNGSGKGAGQDIEPSPMMWSPGSRVDTPTTFQIEPQGTWCCQSP